MLNLTAEQQTITRMRFLESQQRVLQMQGGSYEAGLQADQQAITRLRQLQSEQRVLQIQDQGIPQDRVIRGQLGDSWREAMGRLPDYNGGPATFERLFPNQRYSENLGNSQGGQAALWQGVDALTGYPGGEQLHQRMRDGALKGEFGTDDIKKLQKFLQAQGLELGPGGADGKFGPKTHQALMQFASLRQPDHLGPGFLM